MTWLNALVFILLVAGHTELQVTIVNRVYSLRLPCDVLRRFRHVHDVLIPAFPVLLVWFVGVRGPGLLAGGSWRDVPVGWTIVLALCAAGAAGLAWSTLRWWTFTPAALLQSNHSQVIDVAGRLGTKPVGAGPMKLLTRFPRNEIFQLEVDEKTIRLPRLPAAWDGLSILHVSDLHFSGTIDLPFFREVIDAGRELRPHMAVFTGDLLDRQTLTEWLPETLGRLEAPLGRYFILGNHDWYLAPDETRRALQELGWKDVAGESVTLADEDVRTVLGSPSGGEAPRLVIAGDERPWMGGEPCFARSNEAEFRILLSHTPDNLPWARRQPVDLMLSGHNHGGQVVLPGLGPVYSPSRYGVKYAAGLFREGPTLLHVSRGISGRQPLRYRCRPELTKLVLTSSAAPRRS